MHQGKIRQNIIDEDKLESISKNQELMPHIQEYNIKHTACHSRDLILMFERYHLGN